MSSNVMMINNHANHYALKQFICDSMDDIAKLPKYGVRGVIESSYDLTINDPCAVGSTALVCGSSKVYILTPSNEWKEL